jgi:hypothetical protein
MNINGIYLDVESNGLYGEPWAICAKSIIIDAKNEVKVLSEFAFRQANFPITDSWTKENCWSYNSDIPMTANLQKEFAEWWSCRREGAQSRVWAHMCAPVEAGLFISLVQKGYIGPFEGPFPLIDISGVLVARGEDPTSVDTALRRRGIHIDGHPHDCRYDVNATIKLMEAISKEV